MVTTILKMIFPSKLFYRSNIFPKPKLNMKIALDSTTKNVVQEIMKETTNKGILINENFVVYYVKLLMLNPAWGINSETLLERSSVQRFVKHCVSDFENQCVCMSTLKMQFYFLDNFLNVENMISKNRTDLKERLAPLEREVMETRTENKGEIENLSKKIVFLITLYSGLGNPTIDDVYKEAKAALHSIFDDADLKEFMVDTHKNKEIQIVDLTKLVTGVRLFNRDCGKSGEGIEDLPQILKQAVEATQNDIQNSLVFIMDNVNFLTTVIDDCCRINRGKHNNYLLSIELLEGLDEGDFELVKDLLILYRQYELFVRKILIEVNNMEKVVSIIYERYQKTLVSTHETVRFRIAIPTVQVFPLFAEVATIWCEFQDQAIVLSQMNQMLLSLRSSMREIIQPEDVLKCIASCVHPITDSERLERTTGCTIQATYDSGVTYIGPSNFGSIKNMEFEYLGFCAWMLVETDGGLIPGNPNMGILIFERKCYVFSSREAAMAFAMEPSRYVMRALDLARNKPELINLLQLEERLNVVRDVEKLVKEKPTITTMYNAEVQTELHPIPTNIDPHYTWNVWDLKRQAILLANLSRYATRSTQTKNSCGLQAARTQTYPPKDAAVQTKKDNYSNVPTLSNFIYGLRGRKDDEQHVITLTRPVDE